MASKPTSRDRRRARRYKARLKVRFWSEEIQGTGFTVDVSNSGILLETAVAVTTGTRIHMEITLKAEVPFFADWVLNFWAPAYVVFVALMVAGFSNAVNLSDGLDGLAAGLTAIAAATFGIFAYLIGRVDTSNYLDLFYLPGSGELAIFAVALAGGALGFLWFNAHPAQVFMGDTGSLALGGAIGVISILLKAEFLLVIVGGVFVLEAASVVIQTTYFKYSRARYGEGRRVFGMTPIHHHFERGRSSEIPALVRFEKGKWDETQVVIRFWIIGIFFAMLAFSTLKIR